MGNGGTSNAQRSTSNVEWGVRGLCGWMTLGVEEELIAEKITVSERDCLSLVLRCATIRRWTLSVGCWTFGFNKTASEKPDN